MQRSVTAILTANVAGYVGGINQASAATVRLAGSMESVNGKGIAGMSTLGKAALAGGALVAGGLMKAIQASANFEQAMSEVGAASGSTGAELGALRQAALDAGASTMYSATEAAQGITAMSKAGVSAADILGGGLSGALNLAAAGSMGVAEAAEVAATMLSQFNLSGDKMTHVSDVLAATAGKAQGSVSDVGQAMKYAGPIANAMGVSLEETAGTLGLFAQSGIIGEQAGTSFRGMLASLTAPSDKASATMKDLGINVYDSTGHFIGMEGVAGQLQQKLGGLTEAQRNMALGTIFGNQQLTAAQVLLKAGSAGVEQWTTKVNDQGYAAEYAAKMTDNLKGDVERLGGALETSFISQGGQSNDALRMFVQNLTDAVPQLTSILGALLQVGGGFVSLGTGVLSGLAPIVGVVGKLAGAFAELPQPIQLAVAGMVTFFAFRDKIGGFFNSFTTGLGKFRDNWNSLGKVGTEAAQQLELPLGIAGQKMDEVSTKSAGATKQVGFFGKAAAGVKSGVSNLGTSLGGLSGIVGGIGFAAAAAGIGLISQGLSQAQAHAAAYNKMVGDMAQASVGATNSTARLNNQIEVMMDSLSEQQFSSDSGLFAAFDKLNISTDGFEKALHGTKAERKDYLNDLESMGPAGHLAAKGAEEMFAAFPLANEKAKSLDDWATAASDSGASASEAALSVDDFGNSLGQTGDEALSSFEAMKKYLDMLDQIRDRSLSVEEAQQEFNDATRDLGTAWSDALAVMSSGDLVNAAGEINTMTEAGSQLQDSMVKTGDAIKDTFAATMDNAVAAGKTTPEAYALAKAAIDPMTQSLRDQLTQAGLLPEQIDAIVANYAEIPDIVATQLDLTTTGDPLQTVGAIYDQLKELPPETSITVTGLTADAKLALENIGATVTEMEDGTYVITMDVEARAAYEAQIATFVQDIKDELAAGDTTITVNASTGEAKAALEDAGYVVKELSGGRWEITLSADAGEATSQISYVQGLFEQMPDKKTLTVFGDYSAAVDGLAELGIKATEVSDGQWELTMDADTAPADTGIEETKGKLLDVQDAAKKVAQMGPIQVDASLLNNDIIDQLDDIGIKAEDLGNGKYELSIEADTDPALPNVQNFTNTANAIPNQKTLDLYSNAAAAGVDLGTYRDMVHQIPTTWTTTTTSNAPDQTTNFRNLAGSITGTPTQQSTTTWSNAPEQSGNFNTLASRIYGVPVSQSTTTWSNALSTAGSFNALMLAVFGVPSSSSTTVNDNAGAVRDRINAVAAAIHALDGSSATVTVNQIGGAPHAQGGPIIGPGTGTSDDVPIMASNGEFMQRTAAVNKYGMGFMWAVNNLTYDPRVPTYASGGPIPVRPQMPSFSGMADGGPVGSTGGPLQITGSLDIGDGIMAQVTGTITGVSDNLVYGRRP